MTLNEKIDFAVSTIKSLNLKEIPLGKYTVSDEFYYLIQEYDTKLPEDCRLEAHKKYVDIQYIIQGAEAIDVIHISSCQEEVPYNPEKDVAFYKTPDTMQRLELTEGSYAVLLPETAHKPQIAVDKKPIKIKKCVCKIRI